MRIDVLSIFPDYVAGPAGLSLLGKARDSGVLDLRLHDLRDWTTDRHRSVDDSPYGGGAGMVMRADVWVRAVEAVYNDSDRDESGPYRAGGNRPRTILFTPRGRTFDQAMAREFAQEDRLVMCCGRYEGIDERVHELVATDEVSIGDYVLFGGEAAALVVIEAVTRLLPGVVGNEDSPVDESFADGLLEYPHYTRPLDFRGLEVPEILRSGDHAAVQAWRRAQAEELTRRRRPDLLDG
jgi:tRNA (guanine37-N1)-methyltransferase